MESRIWFASKPASLLSCLVLAMFLATLTLWVPAYWPVAAFEIAVFLLAGVAIVLAMQPAANAGFPLIILIVLIKALDLFVTNQIVQSLLNERQLLDHLTRARPDGP